MIEFSVKNRHINRLVCCGSDLEVVAEVCMLINRIYSALYKANPLAAAHTRKTLEIMIKAGSPVFEVDESVSGIFVAEELHEKADME